MNDILCQKKKEVMFAPCIFIMYEIFFILKYIKIIFYFLYQTN
jgi:hypothetical protein